MSGIGFSELVLLFVIGLMILGPERLPKVASEIGRWVGRARRTANQLRHQLEREIALSDIQDSKKWTQPTDKSTTNQQENKISPDDTPAESSADDSSADAASAASAAPQGSEAGSDADSSNEPAKSQES